MSLTRYTFTAFRLAALWLLACCLLLTTGCKELEESFSGLRGTVVPGPMAGAEVHVYLGTQFQGLDSTVGRIATGTVDANGQFSIELPDETIGRTLIVSVNFPRDLPQTVQDDRASYRSYAAPFDLVTVDPADGPWVAVVDFFEGLSAPVTVSPLSTAVYYAVSSLPAADAGPGQTRWVQANARLSGLAIGLSFGITADPARTVPALPDLGSGVTWPRMLLPEVESTRDSPALTHVLIQLDRAAQSFAAATGNGPMDFYRALIVDASDGALDGHLHGQAIAALTHTSLPNLLGLTADGSSRLVRWVETTGDVTPQEIEALEASVEMLTIFPPVTEIRQLQQTSTGATVPVRITGIDLRSHPNVGQVELTVTGRGLLRNHKVLMSSAAGFAGLEVNQNSTGDRGSLLALSHQRMVVRLPQMDGSFVPGGLRLVGTQTSRDVQLAYVTDMNASGVGGEASHALGTVSLVLGAQAPHIVSARLVRLGTPAGWPLPPNASFVAGASARPGTGQPGDPMLAATTALALHPAGTNPASLDPASDRAYALELRIHNNSTVSLQNIHLNLDSNLGPVSSAETLAGDPVSISLTNDGGVIVIADPAIQSASVPLLSAGQSAWLRVPIVFDAAQIGTGAGQIAPGTPIRVTAVLAATSIPGGSTVMSTDNPTQFLIAAAGSEGTPSLTSFDLTASLNIAAGQSGSIEWTLRPVGEAAVAPRSVVIERVDVSITAPGGAISAWPMPNQPVAQPPLAGDGLVPLSPDVRQSGPLAAVGIPLLLPAGEDALIGLPLRAGLSAAPGGYTVNLTAWWREPATGERGSVTASVPVTVTP